VTCEANVHQAQQKWSFDGELHLPTVIGCLEDELDWFMFEHFNHNLSNVLSIHPDKKHNPFRGKFSPPENEDRVDM
jgi:hypothetical protein